MSRLVGFVLLISEWLEWRVAVAQLLGGFVS